MQCPIDRGNHAWPKLKWQVALHTGTPALQMIVLVAFTDPDAHTALHTALLTVARPSLCPPCASAPFAADAVFSRALGSKGQLRCGAIH